MRIACHSHAYVKWDISEAGDYEVTVNSPIVLHQLVLCIPGNW